MTLSALCMEAAGAAAAPEAWIERLYERAKREQWSLDRDVAWHEFGLERLPARARAALGRIYTHVQAGEICALVMTARAIDSAPELWTKMFGATQVSDEARHVEFFARVLAQTGEPVPLSPSMAALIEELGEAATIDEVMLGTQIVLEGYAQCLFLEGARLGSATAEHRIRLPSAPDPGPFLSTVAGFIGRDESRHLAFGVLYLKRRWGGLDRAARQRLQDRGYRWSTLLDETIRESSVALRAVGVCPSELLERAAASRVRQFGHIGFDI